MNNFAVMDITFTHYAVGLQITLPTNNPCHLTCYYTPTKPRRHKAFRTLRGLTTAWGAYWCYVGWQTVEQNEAGDTLTHTFDFPQWIFCQTRWLAFRGTVNGQTSPSVSPIFKHHHPGPSLLLYQHYNTGETSEYRFTFTTWVAQTFTIETRHAISKVVVMLNRLGLPGQAILDIRATDGNGHPTGPLLTGTTFDANALIEYPGKEWLEIEFPSYPLELGKYAMTMRAPDGGAGNDIGWWGDAASPTYLTGNWELGSYPAGNWSAQLWRDAMFEEWGRPI